MTVSSISSLPFDSSILVTWTFTGGDSNSSAAIGTDANGDDIVGSNPVDSIHLSQIQYGGTFTTGAGDAYRVADLYKITQAKDAPINTISIAIRGAGTLTLDGVDVTNQLGFTED